MAKAVDVLARCAKSLLIAALVAVTGAHWAALQTVAWTTMLATNFCHDSMVQAVSKTFDGEHPCCLCKAIAAAKKSEKKSEAVSSALKMEFPPTADKIILFPPEQFNLLSLQNWFAELFSSPPPLPPPRGCLA